MDIGTDGARNGMMIAEGVENSGSYEWTIPDDQAAADDYTIKVAGAADGTPMDESDEPFSIQETVDAIFEGTFDSDLSGWTTFSTTGDQVWVWADYGNPPGSAKISGSMKTEILRPGLVDFISCRFIGYLRH
ncbi:MAG: hypothetical protein U5L09_08480 [Bacteroidales bacterium]|nr:hypothetical protein [Bacteroidales bacterium]